MRRKGDPGQNDRAGCSLSPCHGVLSWGQPYSSVGTPPLCPGSPARPGSHRTLDPPPHSESQVRRAEGRAVWESLQSLQGAAGGSVPQSEE